MKKTVLPMIVLGCLFGSMAFAAEGDAPGLPNPAVTLLPPAQSPLPSPAAQTTTPPPPPPIANTTQPPTTTMTGGEAPPPPAAPTSAIAPDPAGAGSPIATQQTQWGERMASPNAFGETPTSRVAFTQMLRYLMPLSPPQIVTLRSLFDRSQQAVATYPGTPPKPTSSSILVNMSPGATPPIIRLRDGYVTSMVFLDSTGQPWPVTGYDLGNPKAFNIQPNAPDGKSNTLLIQAMDRYQQGNLAVMLKGENTPVMLTLIPGQRAVDYRVDLRIPGLGPNAVVLSNGLPSSENPVLLNFLDGTPPDGAELLHVEGASAQAWTYQGFLYLRARFSILSPGWIATMSSPDGTHVYELPKTPIILASQRGEMVRLTVKGL